MKIVIDIDEKNYKSVMLTQNCPIGQRLPYGLSETIKNGTMLPDNPTNGDMIKALFPNAQIDCNEKSELVDKYVTVFPKDCDTCQDYSWDWWNAPYNKESD